MVALGAANAAGLLQPLMMYVGIAMLAGVQLAGPARSALSRHCSKRVLISGIDRHRIFERRRNFGPTIVCWVALSTGLTTVFLLAGLIAPVQVLPLLSAGQVESGGNGQSPPSQQTLDGVSLRLETSDFARLILLDAGITTASSSARYYGALGCLPAALASQVCSAQQIRWVPSLAFFALALVGFRAGDAGAFASFAYGFILFEFGLANSLWLGILMIALLGAANAVTSQ